ncbi:MAG: hypothetical protein BWK79_11155, partial [Beggiatoa sp. IS2]
MKKSIILLIIVFILVTAGVGLASPSIWSALFEKLGWQNTEQSDKSFLNADDAFIFSSRSENAETFIVHWQIAEGYYLYRDKLKFAPADGDMLGHIELPTGKIKKDRVFGDIEVYYQELAVKLSLPNRENATLTITYQGCADAGLCYPPLTKTVAVKIPILTTVLPNEPLIDKDGVIQDNNAKFIDKPLSQIDFSQSESTLSLNENSNSFLDPDAAFVFFADFADREHLLLQWQIAKGYYLYRQKFVFSLQGDGKLGTPQFPTTTSKDDPEFGQVEVYEQPVLEILVPIDTAAVTEPHTFTLIANYQGCAEAGLCYPPISKTIELT